MFSCSECIFVGAPVSIAGVREAFDEDGNCIDKDAEEALRGVAGSLLDFITDYVCPKYALEAMVREGGKPWTSTV